MSGGSRNNLFILWATPRSVSTAFERVMKNSEELVIFHEPYTEVYYFGPDRTSKRYGDIDFSDKYTSVEVNRKVFKECSDKKIFMKELAFQAERYIDDEILSLAKNIFITSHPHRVYTSLNKVKPDFTEDEFGFSALGRIYDRVMKFQEETIVVDGIGFRNSPQTVIKKVCDFMSINYTEDLLSWSTGRIREWKPEEVESQLKYHSTLESSKRILPAATQELSCIKSEHSAIVERAEAIYEKLTGVH